MTEQTQTSGAGVSRRALAQGAAWAVPAVAVATAAPAVAASAGQMTVAVTPMMYQTVMTRMTSSTLNPCDPVTNPQKGFIDTMCCGSPTQPPNSDCKQNPNSSDGLWLESSNGQAGKAEIVSATITYTFNRAVSFDGTTYAQGDANSTGSVQWDSPDILGAGWTITSKTATSITLKYSGSGLVDASTGVDRTGFCTGYFINFHVTDGCYTTYGTLTMSTQRTVVYSDSTGTNKTWTKNTSNTSIIA